MIRSVRAAPFAVEVGGCVLGVRSNDPAVHAVLADRLASGELRPCRRADYTVVVAEHEPGARVRPLHRLYWRNAIVAAGRDVDEVLAALGDHLTGYALEPADGTVLLDLAVLRTPAGAVLLPARLRCALGGLHRALARRGLVVHQQPVVRVDAATADLLIDPPLLPLAREVPAGRPAPGERLPVVSVGVGVGGEPPAGRGDTLALLVKAARPGHRSHRRLSGDEFETLGRLALALPPPTPLPPQPLSVAALVEAFATVEAAR